MIALKPKPIHRVGLGARGRRMVAFKWSKKMDLIGRHCIVRTENAGVFAGTVAEKNGNEIALNDARRIWYWDGAASLSQLAVDGTSKPSNCKFPCAVASVLLIGVIEVIPTTFKAQESIASVAVWTK